MRPWRITAMRSLRPRISGSSEEISRTACASSRQAVDQGVDLDLGPDIDAARRLIEDEDRGVVAQPLAEHDLLLIAAAELPTWRRTSGGRICTSAASFWASVRRSRVRRMPHFVSLGRMGSVRFASIGMPSTSPCPLRSSGT